jgi:hypothetical protein
MLNTILMSGVSCTPHTYQKTNVVNTNDVINNWTESPSDERHAAKLATPSRPILSASNATFSSPWHVAGPASPIPSPRYQVQSNSKALRISWRVDISGPQRVLSLGYDCVGSVMLLLHGTRRRNPSPSRASARRVRASGTHTRHLRRITTHPTHEQRRGSIVISSPVPRSSQRASTSPGQRGFWLLSSCGSSAASWVRTARGVVQRHRHRLRTNRRTS